MVQFNCEHCGGALKAPDDAGGKGGSCPHCRKTITSPLLQAAASPASSLSVPTGKQHRPASKGVASFVASLAKYYMDFLETDFHKRRIPKRSIKHRNSSNLLVGVDLRKYDTVIPHVLKVLSENLIPTVDVRKGKYRTIPSSPLIALVNSRASAISEDVIGGSADSIAATLRTIPAERGKGLSEVMTRMLDAVSERVSTDIVEPFLVDVGSSIDNMAEEIGSMETIAEALVEAICSPIEELLGEAVPALFADGYPDLDKKLRALLDPQFVRESLQSYFADLGSSDLFFEVQELVDNNLILDKQDLYLYFCDVSFQGHRYPIFYVPISIEKCEGVFTIRCEPSVYVNKKALEYVLQQRNKESETATRLGAEVERVFYPNEHDQPILTSLSGIVADLQDKLQLQPAINVDTVSPQKAEGLHVAITNSVHLCIFDKSDEALVNDYEELLTLLKSPDSSLAQEFVELVGDFISGETKRCKTAVEDEWHTTPPEKKLVFDSPIPLNAEQRRILSALDRDDCRYVTVEGPPGTGKSHTITAIVFNCILRNKSVLVLSDKREALDVVEEKITDALDRVRVSDDFQNPLLRLGKTGNTYTDILSTASINKTRNHYKAVRSREGELEFQLQDIHRALTSNVAATVAGYGNVQLQDINTLVELEARYEGGDGYPLDFKEIAASPEGPDDTDQLRQALHAFVETCRYSSGGLSLLDACSQFCDGSLSPHSFHEFLSFLRIVQELRITYEDRSFLDLFSFFSSKDLSTLSGYLAQYERLGSGWCGYFLKGGKLRSLAAQMKTDLPVVGDLDLKKDSDTLRQVLAYYEGAAPALKEAGCRCVRDSIAALHALSIIDDTALDELDYAAVRDDLQNVEDFVRKYPKSASKVGIDLNAIDSTLNDPLAEHSPDVFEDLIAHVLLQRKLNAAFGSIPPFDYTGGMSLYQQLLTNQMANIMDRRLLDFYENDRATAQTLRGIIRKKQRFPKDEFSNLKEAFPCIIAGIRDYAEYIPLEPELFDLLIIDEASQVSIAQALPALLRAKKVVVLGDRKQFSNVKTAHARSDTNKAYLAEIENSFRSNIGTSPAELERLTKFNIKTSILEFFEFIANFDIMLLKHFRGYPEHISYSKKHFYDDELQAIRLRGKPIQDALRITEIPHDGKLELSKNINTPEADFILSELVRLKDEGVKCSVGVITPHTNQQKFIASRVTSHVDRDYFYDKLALKIMTFDTCQGEERDVIYYSLVANPADDKLWGVFIKDLASVDLEEAGQIKAQRLNVGFSRAKECMHFVLSKPIEQFSGAIGEALRHYKATLERVGRMPDASDLDPNSPMEGKVLHWISQTRFFDEHKDSIELRAQFPIGDYLKQLDPLYSHPSYRVDFLMLVRDQNERLRTLIIEYDGFSEHFTDRDEVSSFNYDYYYRPEDVEREKVLESYGYKFLRINRFNLGDDPVATLDARLRESTKAKPTVRFTNVVRSLVASQESGAMKECPKCGRLLSLDDFKDASLATGIGRICMDCKAKSSARSGPRKRVRKPKPATTSSSSSRRSGKSCPKCGSSMVRRTGPYGAFYGCSQYPRCRGTRKAR